MFFLIALAYGNLTCLRESAYAYLRGPSGMPTRRPFYVNRACFAYADLRGLGFEQPLPTRPQSRSFFRIARLHL